MFRNNINSKKSINSSPPPQTSDCSNTSNNIYTNDFRDNINNSDNCDSNTSIGLVRQSATSTIK